MNKAADILDKHLGNQQFQERMKQISSQLEQHPAVQQLVAEYGESTFTQSDLWRYKNEYENCQQCKGLVECKNMVKGHQMVVTKDEWYPPQFALAPCDRQIGYEKEKQIKSRIKSHNVPDHIIDNTFAVLEKDPGRIDAIKMALQFCASFEKGKTKKGLYLYGSWGVGKSAIAGAMTQELGKRGIDVAMVYVPDFLVEIKASIETGGMDQKISSLKKVSVLILDDIGAEALTPWTRDDVLGAILQYRMERLPTIYTSNLTMTELEKHLALNANDRDRDTQVKKAKRIMERIKPFVLEVEVKGRNRRHDKNGL